MSVSHRLENMLKQFAIMCGGDYRMAIVLNHLYYEAIEQNRKGGNYTCTIDVVGLAKELCIDEDYIPHLFVFLEDGEGLIYTNSHTSNEKEFVCTTYVQTIDWIRSQIPIEEEKVKKHNKRAIELNNPGTLDIGDWIHTLNRFDWKCAYCEGNYDVLEHVIPLTFPSSGTTRWNCVPSCHSCNGLKGPYHPERLPQDRYKKLAKGLERVNSVLMHYRR